MGLSVIAAGLAAGLASIGPGVGQRHPTLRLVHYFIIRTGRSTLEYLTD